MAGELRGIVFTLIIISVTINILSLTTLYLIIPWFITTRKKSVGINLQAYFIQTICASKIHVIYPVMFNFCWKELCLCLKYYIKYVMILV